MTPPQASQGPAPSRAPQVWRAALPIGVALVLSVLPAPSGLAPGAWHYFALFAAVVIALVTEPIPGAAVGVLAVTLIACLGLPFSTGAGAMPKGALPAESIKWALGGFSNSTVWLIFGAFVFAMGYEETGLGRRIALFLVRRLGGRTLGLGYAIALSDLVLAPFTPSNTARSAGTLYPVIRGIPALYGSHPGPTSRKIGGYLMWTAFASTCVTSSMFVTAVAPNLLALDFVRKIAGVDITWAQWLWGFLPVGGLLILILPWLVYKLYPPEIKTSAEVPRWAARELEAMGPTKVREWIMGILVVIALFLWIFGGEWIDPTMVALVAIGLMLIGRVVTWNDILGNKHAWNVLVWFATMVTLADGLNRVGFTRWLGADAAHALLGLSPTFAMVSLVALYFFIHYMFAGLTAHVTALLPVFLAAGSVIPGLPIRTYALLLVYSLGIMGVLTPYGCGPAPVYFDCGFISRRDFWRLGFFFGALFIVALMAYGLFSAR